MALSCNGPCEVVGIQHALSFHPTPRLTLAVPRSRTTNPWLIPHEDHVQEGDKDRQMLCVAVGVPRCNGESNFLIHQSGEYLLAVRVYRLGKPPDTWCARWTCGGSEVWVAVWQWG
jgi:hypothetical protein